MPHSNRPRDARWRAVRSSWRQQLPLVAKLLAALSIVSYLYWNMSVITHLSVVPSLRSESAGGVAQELRDSVAATQEGGEIEIDLESWLTPEYYRKDVRLRCGRDMPIITC